jgi:UDP-N-acetylmuramate dehydrogenase
VTPRSSDELKQILAEAREYQIPVTVIGFGSNLLVGDAGIRGLVIRMARGLRQCRLEGNHLTAEAGVMLSSAASMAADAGLSGLEFASGIPGTVGGGVLMNAGAYGGEMSQVVSRVTLLSPDGSQETRPGAEMDFGYRHSAIQDTDRIVTQVEFALQPGDSGEIRRRMSELNRRRAEKQPLDMPSAGSTFKRPENGYAAALIDQCGLKGFSIGGASVSTKHAGFLLNNGGTSSDYLSLIRYVRNAVREKTGVLLEPEIRILPPDLYDQTVGLIPN